MDFEGLKIVTEGGMDAMKWDFHVTGNMVDELANGEECNVWNASVRLCTAYTDV